MTVPSWSASLLPQLEHHFRWLSKATQGIGVEQACFQLAPGRPSIAWLLGHLTAGADSVAEAVAGTGPALAPDFLARHGSPHWAVDGTDAWNNLRDQWTLVSERTRRGLNSLQAGDLELEPAIEVLPEFAEQLSTRHAFLAGEIFHFAYHLGQIGTLRAAQDLGWS